MIGETAIGAMGDRVIGYLDRISVLAGETVTARLSAPAPVEAEVALCAILDGGGRADQRVAPTRRLAAVASLSVAISHQPLLAGSCYTGVDRDGSTLPRDGSTVWALVFPTVLARQAVVAWTDPVDGTPVFELGLDGAAVVVCSGEDRLVGGPVDIGGWSMISVTLRDDTAEIEVRPITGAVDGDRSPLLAPAAATTTTGSLVAPTPRPCVVRIGASGAAEVIVDGFTGKIGHVGVTAAGSAPEMSDGRPPSSEGHLALWDPTPPASGDTIGPLPDGGPAGVVLDPRNSPLGLVTGPGWSGDVDTWVSAPAQYAARHYAADRLTDCRWDETVTMTVPPDTASGVYAVEVSAPGGPALFAFVVRPGSDPSRRRPAVVVLPTASYLALGARRTPHPAVHTPIRRATGIGDVGGCTLDTDAGGDGVALASRLRPLAELDPSGRSIDGPFPDRFALDLALLGFLRNLGIDADVITDEDLDRDGVAALRGHRVAITGAAPAYATRAMLDAWTGYLSDGGRLAYLGGGGFHWVTSFDADRSMVEVRRGESGSRTWQARPGELGHALDPAERCGLWRTKGRSPHKLVGVGLTAEGRSAGVAYVRMPDSAHRAVAWAFEGIGSDPLADVAMGERTVGLPGAAAMEVDRYDALLGSPPHARILATAMTLPDDYRKVAEEVMFNHPGLSGNQDVAVRADMVLFTTRSGGAVFSAGSSNFLAAVAADRFGSEAATLAENVLRAFVADGALRGSRFTSEDALVRR
jgi:N,N-dimethylformamidase